MSRATSERGVAARAVIAVARCLGVIRTPHGLSRLMMVRTAGELLSSRASDEVRNLGMPLDHEAHYLP